MCDYCDRRHPPGIVDLDAVQESLQELADEVARSGSSQPGEAMAV